MIDKVPKVCVMHVACTYVYACGYVVCVRVVLLQAYDSKHDADAAYVGLGYAERWVLFSVVGDQEYAFWIVVFEYAFDECALRAVDDVYLTPLEELDIIYLAAGQYVTVAVLGIHGAARHAYEVVHV